MSRTIILTSYIEAPFDMAANFKKGDKLICTDGGYDIALACGLKPSLLIGDFDSVKAKLPGDIPLVRFKPEKDFTDLQLAIDTALKDGARDVEIWGGVGGRLDHTVANIQLLAKYASSFASLVIRDGACEAFALSDKLSAPSGKSSAPSDKAFALSDKSSAPSDKAFALGDKSSAPSGNPLVHERISCSLCARDGWYLSLFSLSEETTGLKVTGAKYTLDDYTMTSTFPIGVSNEFAGETIEISFDSGTLLVILAKKD